jgi:hypothetical protein
LRSVKGLRLLGMTYTPLFGASVFEGALEGGALEGGIF